MVLKTAELWNDSGILRLKILGQFLKEIHLKINKQTERFQMF